VVGIGDVQASVTDPEETDYFGFVEVGVALFALDGERDSESVWFGCGGYGQLRLLGENRLKEPVGEVWCAVTPENLRHHHPATPQRKSPF